jgi:site-specific DNA recombinase
LKSIGSRRALSAGQAPTSAQWALLCWAPYGYRYIPKQEGVPGHIIIDETEAEMVRRLYQWLLEEQLTIRQLLKRLNFGPWFPRSGKHPWSASVVHHILSDPIYTGVAYVNRYQYVPAKKPQAPRRPTASENACRQLKPQEEWIGIPVPALIDQATYDRVQQQLARNAALSFRHNTKYSYLLRCLLTCKHCGLAMFGVAYQATETLPERRYYKCHGTDCIMTARMWACPRRRIKAAELEEAVWGHVRQLLEHPEQLLTQFERFSAEAIEGDVHEQAEAHQLAQRLERVSREERRLLDAYQAGVIELAELADRRQHLSARRRALLEQQEQQAQLRQQRWHAQAVLTDLTRFCEQVRSRLEEVTFEEKQAILQLLIERIIVGDETLEIRCVIPLAGTAANGSGADPPTGRLRSDGVRLTALPGGPLEVDPHGFDQAAVIVGDHQVPPLQAASLQPGKQARPTGFRFAIPQLQAQNLPIAGL